MKSIIILAVLFFTTFLAQAQANNENVSLEVETTQVEMVQTIETYNSNALTFETENTMEIARLYKNNRIIIALEFTIKANNPKIA